jgi:hypothetical protein
VVAWPTYLLFFIFIVWRGVGGSGDGEESSGGVEGVQVARGGGGFTPDDRLVLTVATALRFSGFGRQRSSNELSSRGG